MEHLFTLQVVESAPGTFIEFWERQYSDVLETLYDVNISVKPFTDKAIRELFEWKNGGELSAAKRASVARNFMARKDEACVHRAIGFTPAENPEGLTQFAKEFLTNDFREGGAIWRIYWLHCCNQAFPIYDQHVHRAMTVAEDGRPQELSQFPDDRKIQLYLEKYLSFHARFSGEQRKVDRAIHTFGRFIKAWPDLCVRSDKTTHRGK